MKKLTMNEINSMSVPDRNQYKVATCTLKTHGVIADYLAVLGGSPTQSQALATVENLVDKYAAKGGRNE